MVDPFNNASDHANTSTATTTPALLSTATRASLAAAVILVAVVGVVGNGLVVALVYRKAAMRSAINLLVAQLAVSDVLLSASLPALALPALLLGPATFHPGLDLCAAGRFVQESLVTVNVSVVVAISLDRYLMVVHRRETLTTRRARGLIAAVWVFSLLACCGPLVGWGTYGLYPGHPQCLRAAPEVPGEPSYVALNCLLARYLPLAGVCFALARIVSTVRRKSVKVHHYSMDVGGGLDKAVPPPQLSPRPRLSVSGALRDFSSPASLFANGGCASCLQHAQSGSRSDVSASGSPREDYSAATNSQERKSEVRCRQNGGTFTSGSPRSVELKNVPSLNSLGCVEDVESFRSKKDSNNSGAISQNDEGSGDEGTKEPKNCVLIRPKNEGPYKREPPEDPGVQAEGDVSPVSCISAVTHVCYVSSNSSVYLPTSSPPGLPGVILSTDSFQRCAALDCRSSPGSGDSSGIDSGRRGGLHARPLRVRNIFVQQMQLQPQKLEAQEQSQGGHQQSQTRHSGCHHSSQENLQQCQQHRQQENENRQSHQPNRLDHHQPSQQQQLPHHQGERPRHPASPSGQGGDGVSSGRSPRRLTTSLNSPSGFSPLAQAARRSAGARRQVLDVSLKTRAFKTILTLSLLLLVCWLPYVTALLVTSLTGLYRPTLLCGLLWLGLAKSALNPVVYGLRVRKFREACRDALPLACRSCSPPDCLALVGRRRVNPSAVYQCADSSVS